MEQQVKPSWEMQDLQPVCPNSCWEGGSAVPLPAGAPFFWNAPWIVKLQVSSHWIRVSRFSSNKVHIGEVKSRIWKWMLANCCHILGEDVIAHTFPALQQLVGEEWVTQACHWSQDCPPGKAHLPNQFALVHLSLKISTSVNPVAFNPVLSFLSRF